MTNRRVDALAAILAIGVYVSGIAPGAHAGTVDINSCGAAAAGGRDNAWKYVSDDVAAYQLAAVRCPPDGTQFGGITARTTLHSGATATQPAGAQLRFTAPMGSTITRVRIRRDIGLADDGYYVFGRTNASQLSGETCSRIDPAFTCDVGGPAAPEADFPSLSASWVAWGFRCGANGYVNCGTGTTFHQAWATIYSSTVTLTDNQAPTGVAVGGALAAGGWKGGGVAATATGSDNLGIRTVRWYADGALVGGAANSTELACDFSTPVPCSDVTASATTLDTTALADGTRSVQLALVDPAGNETRSAAVGVQVDNTAPPPPSGLVVTGGGGSPSISMRWTTPGADGGAPYVGSAWTACSGATCASGSGGPTSAAGSLPAVSGTYTVKVWLVDQAGNGRPSSAATYPVTYAAPLGGGAGGSGAGGGAAATGALETAQPAATEAPAIPAAPSPPTTLVPAVSAPPRLPSATVPTSAALKVTTAAISKRTGRLVVRGRLNRRATGSVTITYRARVAGRRWSRSTRVRIRRGRFGAELSVPPSPVARRARVTVRFAGTAGFASATRTVAL